MIFLIQRKYNYLWHLVRNKLGTVVMVDEFIFQITTLYGGKSITVLCLIKYNNLWHPVINKLNTVVIVNESIFLITALHGGQSITLLDLI